jgi:phage terminase large subunit-like protein
MADPVTQYATDVVEGRVIAGAPGALACQRHLNDLERRGERASCGSPTARRTS